jgi:hypothetical protein
LKYEEWELLLRSIKFRDKTRAKVSEQRDSQKQNRSRRSASRSTEYYRQQQIMNLLFELFVRRVFARFNNLPPVPTAAIIFHYWRLIDCGFNVAKKYRPITTRKNGSARNSSLEATYVVLRVIGGSISWEERSIHQGIDDMSSTLLYLARRAGKAEGFCASTLNAMYVSATNRSSRFSRQKRPMRSDSQRQQWPMGQCTTMSNEMTCAYD